MSAFDPNNPAYDSDMLGREFGFCHCGAPLIPGHGHELEVDLAQKSDDTVLWVDPHLRAALAAAIDSLDWRIEDSPENGYAYISPDDAAQKLLAALAAHPPVEAEK